MNFKWAGLLLLLLIFTFQNCSIDGEQGGLGNLPSTGGSSLPTLLLDSTTTQIANGATNLVISGTCNTLTYTQYYFDVSFLSSGSSVATPKQYSQPCLNSRFSLNVVLSEINATSNGDIILRLVGRAPNGSLVESLPAYLSVSYGNGSGGSMLAGHGVMCSSNWTYSHDLDTATAQACHSYCVNQNADGCEWDSTNNDCWTHFGGGCQAYTAGHTADFYGAVIP